jgi:DNA mismatch endonuclease, patch repair protein
LPLPRSVRSGRMTHRLPRSSPRGPKCPGRSDLVVATRRSTRQTKPPSARRQPRPETADSSFASTPAIRKRMQLQRTRDTAPEIALRRILHAGGLRYRVDYPPIASRRRRADIVFTRLRVAVFVDGCFWHGCAEHGTHSKSNVEWWEQKIQRNRNKDAETDQLLIDSGWLVIRIWEHESPNIAAERIRQAVTVRRLRLEARDNPSTASRASHIA